MTTHFWLLKQQQQEWGRLAQQQLLMHSPCWSSC